MGDRIDPKNLHRASDGTLRDYQGNIRNEAGYMIAPTKETIARNTKQIQARTEDAEKRRAQFDEMIGSAVRNAGGWFHMPGINFGLGFAGIFMIGFFGLSILAGLMLFLESPDGERTIRSIGDFFSSVGFHIAAFLFAWPQTFSEMFKHWFYLPELLIGLFLLYYLIKTAQDNGFYKEDGLKCFAPYLLIEGIRALFLKDPGFTKLACILRGCGLGIGLCLLVWIARKILIRN